MAKILVSKEALAGIPPNNETIRYRYIGRIQAVGKIQGLDLYEILDDSSWGTILLSCTTVLNKD